MTFRILSFCGGGIRGYLSVLMLKKLQDEVRLKTGNDKVKILDHFDMVAGTSTGAIISVLITLGYNKLLDKYLIGPEVLIDIYRPIMQKRLAKMKRSNPQEPEFESFTKLLKDLAKFDELDHDMKLSSFKKNKILTTSFNVLKSDEHQPGYHPPKDARVNTSWGMVLFSNFENSDTKDTHILDAMAASGAMPGMSGTIPVTWDNPVNGKTETMQCIDGAFVNHNPTIPAVAAAVANGHKLEDISVIDFGTGFMRNYMEGDFENWGSQQWLSQPSDNTSNTPPLFVNSDAKIPVLNAMLNGTSTNEMPTLNSMLLGDRYAYLNADFGDTYVPEDASDDAAMDFMKSQVDDTVDASFAADLFISNWLQT